MKNLALTILLFSFCTFGFAQGEQLEVTLSDPTAPGTLKVSLVTGSIHVKGTSNKNVIVNAVVHSEKNLPQNGRDGMKRISGNQGYELTAVEKNNTVSVRTNNPNQNLSLTISVPKNFSVQLSTVNNGEIKVENVSGNLEISNVNNDISLTNVSGSVVANTINGDVTANFISTSANTPMAFTTLNGDVDVTLPANIKADLKVQTQRGEIFSDFEIAVSNDAPKVTKSGEGGMQKIKRSSRTMGKINSGGSEIMMKTMNGDILIRKAK
ncbi:MAG: hypothetical protein ACI9IP_002411 [Arcticibacterium sp.]|jgi:hypothetical protein